ncbi:hypothetical protein CBFG_03559 [Clostridiales bacterium 1_7_47FAA]|nr:hypothetical protein CBFG_03559 [Clostridiales bacterium 1_7_47FAA]
MTIRRFANNSRHWTDILIILFSSNGIIFYSPFLCIFYEMFVHCFLKLLLPHI